LVYIILMYSTTLRRRCVFPLKGTGTAAQY